MPTLSTIDAAVNAAARLPVVESFERLKQYWSDGRWLGIGNYYNEDTSNRVKDSEGTFKDSQLTDYIAASTVGHCFDGWSFLGRALEAELAGDPGSARHMGYYAELRAAMSLLACEGIGIFNNSHAVVGQDGTCSRFGHTKGTHRIVWEVLADWSNKGKCSDRLLGVISPGGIPLVDWIRQFNGSGHFVTSNWLEKWGLDLERLKSDHAARNLASYRPASLSGAPPAGIEKTIVVVDRLWAMCEPGGRSFGSLDLHLVRQALVQIVERGGDGFAVPQGHKRESYDQRVDRMLDGLVTGPLREETERFLRFETESEASALLLDASGDVDPDHVDHSKQVLARATLLLRLATGSVSQMLKESGADFGGDLEFWWSREAVRRRLWSVGEELGSFSELWGDVESALEDAEAWLESPETETSHWGFWREQGQAGWMLSTVERAFLWGVA